MTESEWNWPILIIFGIIIIGMIALMAWPDGNVITETCTTTDNITKCVITESYR